MLSLEVLSNLIYPVILCIHLKHGQTMWDFFFLAHLNPMNTFLPFLNVAVNEYLVKTISGAWKAIPGSSYFTARQGFTDWPE